jgi:hypothetical protein
MSKYYHPNGTYAAYTNDDKNLFDEAGKHIGYFQNGFLYDPKGIAIGHVKGKVILNKAGQTLYYRE